MIKKSGVYLATAVLSTSLFVGCERKAQSDPVGAAKTHMAQRDWSAAVVELKTALQAKPDSGEARFLMGVALLEQGEDGAAALELAKAAEAGYDDEQVAPKLARAWLGTGRLKEVVQTYGKTSLTKTASHVELRTAVAVAHGRLNQRADAARAVEEALRADPAFPWALLTKARVLASDGKFDEALQLATRAAVPGQSNGEAHLFRGSILRLVKKDLEGAVKAFHEAAQDPLAVTQAKAALMQVALQRQDVGEAKAQLAELQKVRPKAVDTYYLTAVVAYADKDYAKADAIVDQLLRLAPENTKLLMLGGATGLQRGNLIAAETRLGKVVQTVEKAPLARKMLAETYLRMGQAEKALGSLRPLLEGERVDADALSLAGQAHLQAGNAQEAENAFASALKLKPEDSQLRTALALTEMLRGNVDTALDSLQTIAGQDRGDTADLALISTLMRRREFDSTLAAIARFEQKAPSKPTASHLRGLALHEKGDLAAARAAFEAALRIDPAHYSSVASLAALDVREHKLEAARQRLDATVKSAPRNIAARMALLDVARRSGAKPEELLAGIEEAIKADPTDPAPRLAKIAQLARMSDIKAAASAAQNALAALPLNADVLDAAGRALAASGDDQQAISAFNKLATVMPGSPLPFLRIAEVYNRRGDREASAASLSRAFEVAPLASEVHRRLLTRAVSTRDFKGVETAAKTLQKKYPASAVGYLLEGDLETARKAWPAALAAYRAALSKKGGESIAQRAVYSTLVSSGDRSGAERFAADWIKSHPRESELREHLGGEAILRKDYKTAEQHFRQVVELKPLHLAALNNLAWLMAEQGKLGAVAMAERAIALSPHAAPVLDTLARALASEGQVDRAIEVQRRAVATMPERHEYRLNLARLYAKAGRKAEASTELDSLAKLGDRFAFQAEVTAVRSLLIAK